MSGTCTEASHSRTGNRLELGQTLCRPLKMPKRKPRLAIESRFWLTCDGESLAGRGRIELLRRIAESGSIRQAALAMGMSYRAAWDAVDAMNRRAGIALITRKVGGSGGGGAELSEAGNRLLALFAQLEDEHSRMLDEMSRLLGSKSSL